MPESHYIFYRQLQNIWTKWYTEHQMNENLQTWLDNSKFNIVNKSFWETDSLIVSIFSKKGTRVLSMEEIKSTKRCKHNAIPEDTSLTHPIPTCSIQAVGLFKEMLSHLPVLIINILVQKCGHIVHHFQHVSSTL